MNNTAPRLPSYVPPATSLRRAPASAINAAQPRQSTLTLNGLNALIPVPYGEVRLTGLHLVSPRVYASKMLMAVAWGWGECEGVQSLYINGAAAPGGVTLTHYSGTDSQTPDATLTAAIPGFNDAFTGIAYTVIQVPVTTVEGFPTTCQVEAVFRGRKIYDPRTGITAWTRNPALFVYDFITSTRYGPGQVAYGIEDCADRCDEVLGGIEARCEAGLTLSTGQTREAVLDLLTAYAECLWVDDDDGVLVVPDAPVESPAAVISRSDILAGTFRINGADLANAPSVVNVSHAIPSGTAEAWSTGIESAKLPGVDTGEVPEIISNVEFPGVTRATEAYRKALSRLRRVNFPGRYAWQTLGTALQYQRGDLVQLPDIRGLVDCLVRILSVEMIGAGVYQITAEHYDPSIYPDDVISTGTTTVPVGGIVPYIDSTLPSGWEWYSAADGLMLKGLGDATSVGDTGGSAAFTISGNTAVGGAHTGNTDSRVRVSTGSAGTGAYDNLSNPDTGHTHSYSRDQTLEPLWWRQQLIRKTGAPGQLPVNGGVFADGQLITAALSAVTTYVGRLVKAGSGALGGVASPRNVAITFSDAGAHDHRSNQKQADGTVGFGDPKNYVAAPTHNHGSKSIPITFNVKRRKLAHYVATATADIVPGAIVMYDSAEALPAGWHLCDGANGAVDLRDYFIELATPTDAGAAAGNNTITWSGTTDTDGAHSHTGTDAGSGIHELAAHGTETGGHTHGVSGSVGYEPPFYVIKFIQYTGA